MESDTKSCRIAFYGKVAMNILNAGALAELQSKLRVFKNKERSGVVDRISDKTPEADGSVRSVVARGMFEKDADMTRFLGKKLKAPGGEEGRLESSFGKTGKFNAYFSNGAKLSKGDKLVLQFKHMVFADKTENKKINQS
jgi:selenocysteine-specific elongation factor